MPVVGAGTLIPTRDSTSRDAFLRSREPCVNPDGEINEFVECGGEVQDVDFSVDAVSQPMQEHVPLRLLVPATLRRQGAELDRIVGD
jgi:hypothetical protein